MRIRKSLLGLILSRGPAYVYVNSNVSAFSLPSKNLSSTMAKNAIAPATANTMTIPSTTTTATSRNFSTSSSVTESDPKPPSSLSPSPSFHEMQFGKFSISSSQIFYKSPTNLTAAIVNLRPIVPGHVLVIPHRVVPHLSQLNDDEYDDLWRSVRIVQRALEEHYDAGGFNVAVQDGRVAGQSVPHVHVHILPRNGGDFERNDDVYDALEAWAPTERMMQAKVEENESGSGLDVPEDDERVDRTMQMMEDEALTYRSLLYKLC